MPSGTLKYLVKRSDPIKSCSDFRLRKGVLGSIRINHKRIFILYIATSEEGVLLFIY